MAQPKVEVFTAPVCFYCKQAKSLLELKGIAYQEIDISEDPELRANVMERSGGRTSVPQIFINDKHVGGFAELRALDISADLDEWLKCA